MTELMVQKEICLSCFLTPNYWQMSGQTFFFLMPVCSEFCKIQKYYFSVLILIAKLHSRSYITKYGLIIYIAHMFSTLVLVSKQISVLFKKPKKWNGHFLVGIIWKRLLLESKSKYLMCTYFEKENMYLVGRESVKTSANLINSIYVRIFL